VLTRTPPFFPCLANRRDPGVYWKQEITRMLNEESLVQEIKKLPSRYQQEIVDFVGYLKSKSAQEIPETMLLSESALAKDWDTAEEAAAWAGL
jgi:hypothetical protein